LDHDACYAALRAHDARYDGLFFVAVKTTGIYCRPVCPARAVNRENCTFYESAALAEQAGYRPCLRCRPELAPGRAHVDRVEAWARRAMLRIQEGALDEMSVAELATSLGISARQLHRTVQDRYGVSPIQLAQTRRLLTAKRLLADTRLPIGEVAQISGFSSLRRFNACFQERYNLAPTAIRKRQSTPEDGIIRCELGYRPPFSWPGLLDFLKTRAIVGVEAVTPTAYARTVRCKNGVGWVEVTHHPTRYALVVRLSDTLSGCLPTALERIRRLFDLEAEPEAIHAVLGELAECYPGIRLPGSFDGFETAVRAILGQQVTVSFAATLAGRITTSFGEDIRTPFPNLTKLFPKPAQIAELPVEKIAELGIIRSRANAIKGLAQEIAAGNLNLKPSSDPEETRQALLKVSGIGEWTADYILMRCLSYPDAFPAADLGVLKALGTRDPKQAYKLAERWRPWRAYAVMCLWKSGGAPNQ
jgi:AraC family transcriptional regulator of adaptative response / DNA-3-methyladenine glycosylase II